MRVVSGQSPNGAGAPAALGFALLLACCSGPAPPASRTPTERDTPSVELLLADADVWAWTARVEGVSRGGRPPERCSLRVREQEVPARTHAHGFSADLALQEGDNAVRGTCRWSNGAERRSQTVRLRVRLRDVPQTRATLAVAGATLHLDARLSAPSAGSRAPIVAYTWTEKRGGLPPAGAERQLGDGAELRIAAPRQDGIYVYEVTTRDARGRSHSARVALTWRGGRPAPEQHWVDDAVFYGVVPPFFGTPPLRSVEKEIPALAELGVTALWLSPSTATLPQEFGYAITNYFKVRPDYGTDDDFRALVRTAHAHGVRVVLDIVPNHTSAHHPYFEQALKLGARSRYFSFYARDAEHEPTHYFDWEHLPNLNFEHPEVRTWMSEVGQHWLDAFDVDGYRVDAVWGVKERRPQFLGAWSEALRRVEPELVLIAEASARDPFYVQNGFDGAYDWTQDLGKWAWERVFDSPRGIAQRLHAAVEETARRTPRPERVFRFLNNNDTGKRFITRHGPDLTRVATAALLTLPGVPCIYSFDEIGSEAEPYAGLRPAPRPDNPELRDWHRRWIALRRSHAALRGRGFVPLLVGEQNEVYVYLRHARDEREAAIVALNFSASPARVTVSVPSRFATVGARWQSANGAPARLFQGATLALELAAWDAQVLVPAVSAAAQKRGTSRGRAVP